jgi:plasmid maintenance system antidote protein VapI
MHKLKIGSINALVRGLKGITNSLVDDILEGKRNISSEYAQKLGSFFHVEPTLFTE